MATVTKKKSSAKSTSGVAKERVDPRLLQGNLVAKLQARIDAEGLRLTDFAKKYDIPYSILTGVLANTRSVAHSDKEKVVKPIARVLGVPVAMVYVYAGLFDPIDFEFEDSLEKRIMMAYDVMAKDDHFAPFILNRNEFNQLSLNAKTSFVMLYQFASNNKILKMIEAPPDVSRKKK